MQTNELYRLFHKRWTQQITKDEAGQLSALLQDEQIRETHDQLYKTWNQSEDYHPNIDFNAEEGLARFKEKIASKEHRSSGDQKFPRILRMKPPVVLLRVAASILVLFALSVGIYFYLGSLMQEIITDRHNVEYVHLPDGSEVWVNKDSYFSYPKYNIGPRKVELHGEAYFKITPDKEKPFAVKTPKAQVTVLGTSFNVKASAGQDEFSLKVDEGLVELEYEEQVKLKVKTQEKFEFDQNTDRFKKSALTSLNAGAWKDQVLRFRDTPLDQVFTELEQYWQISIDSDQLIHVNCTFTSPINRTMGDIILALQSAFPQMKIEGPDQKRYVISGRACH